MRTILIDAGENGKRTAQIHGEWKPSWSDACCVAAFLVALAAAYIVVMW